jgi:NADPH:quinone reductase
VPAAWAKPKRNRFNGVESLVFEIFVLVVILVFVVVIFPAVDVGIEREGVLVFFALDRGARALLGQVIFVQCGAFHGRQSTRRGPAGNRLAAKRVSSGVKAIRVERHGGPETLQLVEVPIPEPGPGEIRVKQTAAGVNYIDVYLRTGVYKREAPFLLGREGAGSVDALGAGVSEFQLGERVAYLDTPHLGGYAQFALVPAAEAVPIPAAVDDRTACAVMLQGLTAHYLVNSTYPVAAGETIVIHAAAGGVGLLLTQLAKIAGATVIATAGGPEKVALVQAAGADAVIDYRTTDFAPEVQRITNGRGAAAVYDSVGRDTWERSMAVLAKRGYLVIFGAASGPVPPIDPLRLAAAGSLFLTRPTLGDYKRTRAELLGRMNELFALIMAGKLDVRIGATYPLAEAATAHRDLEARATTGKILLVT